MKIARVIVDITHSNVDKVYEYLSIDGVSIGDRVQVPFGRQCIEGFVVDMSDTSEYDVSKLKSIIKVLDEMPPLFGSTLTLAKYLQSKYYSLYSEVLRLFIPSEMRNGRVSAKTANFVKNIVGYEEGIALLPKSAKAQQALFCDICDGGNNYTLLSKTYSYATLTALKKKGLIEEYKEKIGRIPYEFMEVEKQTLTLTANQQRAIDTVLKTDKMTTLIKGVTGSGKTEIYLRLFEEGLKRGKGSIMLVPEIALTPQMVGKLRAFFGDGVAILHSRLSKGERFDEWWRIRTGEAKIVVGARSAIFAPLENIAYIVVDEEHEQSYVSETSPRYDTIDVAKFRANFDGAKLVLGSATPSIESYYNAKNGEYELVEINERVNNFILPTFDIIDLKNEIMRGNKCIISSYLFDQIAKTVEKGEQVILFLNRRGFANYYQCEECGFVCKCNSCDVSLTYHKYENALKCHYCGTRYAIPTTCPHCGGTHFKQGGTGTEAIVYELQKKFKDVRILRMDNDTTTTKMAHANILQEFREGKADILVGTQMVAKGHDFPNVTLVGIVNADMSLYFSDFRSSERTFQLITQVAGRAGRGEKRGRVVLQTYSPQHQILRYATSYDYESFYESEVNMRQLTSFPPFAHIVRVMIVSTDEAKAKVISRGLYNYMTDIKRGNEKAFAYFNGMKSPISRIENKYRFQIISRIVGENAEDIISKIYDRVAKTKERDVNCYVEVNPNSMF